jgi:hypothetical protein
MRGAMRPLPQYASMAWCSVKQSTGTTLPFTMNPLYVLKIAISEGISSVTMNPLHGNRSI